MNKKKEENNLPPISGQKIEPKEITEELRESYLDYAMSVIVARALPDVRDGLKPVQRRILWTMWDNSITHSSKFRKSAYVTGETMGKYHPHGNAAIYDAIARMAQDFSLRYPLIDGQGNWGSIDGDAPAAERYTECRLSKIAEELLLDIEKNTVDFQPNYDGFGTEPKCLPAKLPELLLNGTVGIAVGMATTIPPHNLSEIADAVGYLADKPDASIKELVKIIPGPDFPTGGIIYADSIEQAYTTGKGSVVIRGLAEIEEKKNGNFQIVITEIPYQVNKSDLITKIAELVQEKRIEGIRDVRDESDREGLRIVIEMKNDGAPQKILNQLYKFTELQKNFYFNMLALVNGIQPQILSLKEILSAFIDHRKVVIRRRTEFDLKKAEDRAHILIGLVKALDSIDDVIKTIKKSKDKEEARQNLIKKFDLTPIQSDAILEMRLQTLAALEREKIENELKEKKKLIAELQIILKNPKKIIEIIKTETLELKNNFGDERKSKIISSGLKEFKEEDLVPKEEAIIILTQDGYIKRMAPGVFRSQKRGGKGLIGFELKEEDQIQQFISSNTHDNILFFTNRGRVFQTKVYEISVASRTAKGKSIHNFLTIPADETISAVVSYSDELLKSKAFLVMVTKKGIIKKTSIKEFEKVRKSGIVALRLKTDDELKWAKLSKGDDQIILATELGQAIRFKEKDIQPMGRTATGVKAIRLKKEDFVAGLDIIKTEAKEILTKSKVLVLTANGFAKQTPIKEYKIQKRGGSGIRTSKVTEKTGKIMTVQIVSDENETIIAFSQKGQAIRTELKDIRIAGRSTQGVKIMNLNSEDKLIDAVCI